LKIPQFALFCYILHIAAILLQKGIQLSGGRVLPLQMDAEYAVMQRGDIVYANNVLQENSFDAQKASEQDIVEHHIVADFERICM
jgi:hypothetical protein